MRALFALVVVGLVMAASWPMHVGRTFVNPRRYYVETAESEHDKQLIKAHRKSRLKRLQAEAFKGEK